MPKPLLPFAALLGLGKLRAAAEDEEKKDTEAKQKAEDEEDEEVEAAEDEEKKDTEAKQKAEGEEDEKVEAADEGEEDEKACNTPKKSSKSAERARCAAIMAHGIALGRVNQAGVFAFDTDMTAKQAIAALDAGSLDADTESATKSGLHQDMAAEAGTLVPPPAAGKSTSKKMSPVAAAMLRAAAKARGETVE